LPGGCRRSGDCGDGLREVWLDRLGGERGTKLALQPSHRVGNRAGLDRIPSCTERDRDLQENSVGMTLAEDATDTAEQSALRFRMSWFSF
jgi:hypothetical protein